MNFTSRSETMVLGTPWSLTTSLKKQSATCDASSLLWQGIKFAILENLTTTTKTESFPFLVLGNPKTKTYIFPWCTWSRE